MLAASTAPLARGDWNGVTKLTSSLTAATVQKQQLLVFTLPSVQAGALEIVQTGYGTVDIDGAGAYKSC